MANPQIDPNIATGGGSTTNGIDPSQSTLSPNFDQYVYNMLGKGEGAANQPFQPYSGDRFAGPSQLQNQAFQGLGSLQVPGQYGQAQQAYQNIIGSAGNANYSPTQFNAPQLNNYQMQGPQGTNAPQIGGQLDASNSGTVQGFMNPYQQGVTDIAKREASRNSQIAGLGDAAKTSQAGAFGGDRYGLMQSERERNLGMQQNDLQMQGSNNAFQNAQQALNNQRNASIQVGQSNQQAGLQSMLQNQNLQQQAGTQNLGANLDTQRLGAQQNLQAQQSTDQSRQFGANFGLSALNPQLTAAQGLGSLGTQQGNSQTNILQNQLAGGSTQNQLGQQPLDFGYQQFQDSTKYPQQQASYMQSLLQGLPLQAQQYNTGQSSSAAALQGILGGLFAGGLYKKANP